MKIKNNKFEIINSCLNNYPRENYYDFFSSGAIVTFEGRVRNHNNGLEVNNLEYQAYVEMAQKEGQIIINECLQKYKIDFCYAVHRYGKLKLGDIAVWISVASSHRKEAFLANQFLIDQIKSRLPIWKKECYIDQKAEWVACHHCQKIDM